MGNGQTTYYYDTNYQLKQSDYPNVAPFNAEIDSWTYDSIGNRLTNTVSASTSTYSYYKNGANPLNGNGCNPMERRATPTMQTAT